MSFYFYGLAFAWPWMAESVLGRVSTVGKENAMCNAQKPDQQKHNNRQIRKAKCQTRREAGAESHGP